MFMLENEQTAGLTFLYTDFPVLMLASKETAG